MRIPRRRFLGMISTGAALSATCARELEVSSASQSRAAPPSAALRRGDPWLEISKANLIWNFRQIQSRVGGKPIMAVIKANAYGHGLFGVARVLEAAGANHF